MSEMHQFLSTVPFDLYELALFQLVVKHRSFTKAAQLAGLTQSAMTRQIQGVEHRLGISLLERTTRTVRLTPAGEFLFQEASRLLGDVDQSLHHLAEKFGGARKIVGVDVSRTIGLSYLPGFFHANLRQFPEIGYRVACEPSSRILSALEANEQDIGVLCPPTRLPRTLRVTHRFQDAFTVIAPKAFAPEVGALKRSRVKGQLSWLQKQPWLLMDERSQTGLQMRAWMRRHGLDVDPAMQLDSFDLIIHLVALNMGVSMVPIRALALYHQRQQFIRVPLPFRFTRDIVVVVRKRRDTQEHIRRFIENVLF